jgi:lipopolysaccharide export system permease protein
MAEASNRRAARRSLRFGLIDLYLIRNVALPFLPILLAATAAMILERALRLIQELAANGSDISFFGPMLLRLLPYYLDLALPAAFTAALVVAFARLDERLELEAMLASGLSLARIAAPLVGLGLVVAAASLAVGGWLDPHGRYGYRALRIEALNAGRIGQIQPRALYRPSDRIALTFDQRAAGGGARGLFVWQQRPGGETLALTADSGRIFYLPEGRRLAIDLGAGRYVAWREGREPAIVEFRQLALREPIRHDDARWARGWDQKELTLSELVAADRSGGGAIPQQAIRAEIYGRIAHAAINLLLPLLILPLAFATKKGRRTLGLLIGVALLAAVHHGLNFAKNLALGGAAGPFWPVAAVMGLFAAITFAIFLSGRNLPSHAPIQDLMRPVGRALAGLRPRPSQAHRKGGGTLFAYLAGLLAKSTLLAWIAIALLLQIVDLFERSEQFAARGLGLGDMGHYALLRFAPTLQQALPIAALAGAMIAFTSLGRSREVTAIRAAGLSQWRILAMALPVPLLLALATFLLSEYATPASQLRFAAWWEGTAPSRAAEARDEHWFRISGEIVRAGGAAADGTRLDRVEIFRREGGRLSARIAAAQARLADGDWTLHAARVEHFGGGAGSESDRLTWQTRLQPDDVAAQFASSAPSSAAAYRSLSEQAPMSRGAAPYETRIQRAFAEPLAALVMLLLALPLAFAGPRTGATWPGLLYAGAGGLLYLVGDGILTVAGQVGYLPAAVGAWTAPVIGVLTGLTVLLYSER